MAKIKYIVKKRRRRVYKEIIISIVVIVLVVVLNFFVGKFVDGKLNHILDLLDKMRVAIKDERYDEANEVLEDIKNYWDKSEKYMSCYIEHDELEKIETEFTSLRACLEIREEDCLEYIDRMAFVVKHIEKKDDFVLENIF